MSVTHRCPSTTSCSGWCVCASRCAYALIVAVQSVDDENAQRREPVESVHFGVNSLVQNVTFSLYRDFPDANRHRGEERF